MAERFRILSQPARSILTPVCGFLAQAGFTHSLTPARNCTYGCSYCYVPTMRIYGGLKPEDWRRWGQFTTFKENAAALLERALRPEMIIYCSPLVDPYQPAENERRAMPALLEAVLQRPPAVFVLQTRSPLVLRDLGLLEALNQRTRLRVSFSLTTNREAIRRLYEPHCASFDERLQTIRALAQAGIQVHATLAPLLPCDPEELLEAALEATRGAIVCDPLHLRSVKKHGATTREQAFAIAARHGHLDWFDAAFQQRVLKKMEEMARLASRRFAAGWEGFSWLAQTSAHDRTSRPF